MCGIAGFVTRNQGSCAEALRSTVLRMADTLRHRGPDDRGAWVDAAAGVALGHRRLSILDLTAEGAQPMLSSCGRYVLAYNGEVYDFREVKRDLESAGRTFRGHSDTEVLVEAIGEWGVDEALQRVNGMFAFAVWDRKESKLTLVRDRLGKKPLYYGWCGDLLVFGSELKALRAHPRFEADVDRDALGLLVRYSYIPAPHSILRNVRKLAPGTFVSLPLGTDVAAAFPRQYWSPRAVAEGGASSPFEGSPEQAIDVLDALLRDAVAHRMIADVELGALLSGGIDSSTVVGMMQALSDRPVKTFSIGFHEREYDEAPHAKAVAAHLGTDHRELYVTAKDAMGVIADLPTVYDEPFADLSQIPTLLVSRLAREDVTVALSGDGGDELFAGYNKYYGCLKRWRRFGRVPRPLRRATASAMRAYASMSEPSSRAGGDPAGPLPSWRKRGGKLFKESDIVDAESATDLFARRSERCRRVGEFVVGASDLATAYTDPVLQARLPDVLHRMMYMDFTSFLPEDILVKVDRASMATSLEVRSPLLDRRVVEFAWQVPLSMKWNGRERKWLLRQVLERYVPRALTDRPKMGVGIPVGEWLRGPLREWAESLLSEERLRREGFFRPDAVQRIWRAHLCGFRKQQTLLWSILMFQAWLDRWEVHP